jgi:Flp pilus assembly protein TadD
MLEEAEREYFAALESNPTDPVARGRLAVIALRSGRPKEAVAHYQGMEGAGLGPSRLADLLNWGYALELLERFDEALVVLRRAAELAPTDTRVPLAMGIVLLKSRDVAGAREAFARVPSALGKDAKPDAVFFAHSVLASAAAGQFDEAIRIGREGLSLHPSSAPILVNLGVVLERKGDASAAEALYLRAVALNPPSPHAHRNLGDLAHARGDQAGARAHYERAVRLDPALGDDLYLKLGNLAYEEGDRTWARQHWEKALELNPGNETIRSNLQLISSARDS